MIDIKNILPWILIYSLFFVFSAIFYNQLGAAQFCVIIIMLSFCIFLFKFLSELSNKLSLHSETRIYYGTNRELFVPFIGENKVRSEPKKILKSYTIFNIKLFMGFFLW